MHKTFLKELTKNSQNLHFHQIKQNLDTKQEENWNNSWNFQDITAVCWLNDSIIEDLGGQWR